MKLTAPQLSALKYYATPCGERPWKAPRRDLIGRLVAHELVTVRTAWVHSGLTSRSKMRDVVVDVHVTQAGANLLASAS